MGGHRAPALGAAVLTGFPVLLAYAPVAHANDLVTANLDSVHTTVVRRSSGTGATR
jgi:hypothetical protein